MQALAQAAQFLGQLPSTAHCLADLQQYAGSAAKLQLLLNACSSRMTLHVITSTELPQLLCHSTAHGLQLLVAAVSSRQPNEGFLQVLVDLARSLMKFTSECQEAQIINNQQLQLTADEARANMLGTIESSGGCSIQISRLQPRTENITICVSAHNKQFLVNIPEDSNTLLDLADWLLLCCLR
jgi:hypothetical protein